MKDKLSNQELAYLKNCIEYYESNSKEAFEFSLSGFDKIIQFYESQKQSIPKPNYIMVEQKRKGKVYYKVDMRASQINMTSREKQNHNLIHKFKERISFLNNLKGRIELQKFGESINISTVAEDVNRNIETEENKKRVVMEIMKNIFDAAGFKYNYQDKITKKIIKDILKEREKKGYPKYADSNSTKSSITNTYQRICVKMKKN